VSALFITIYILPHIREKAQLLLDFFDKLKRQASPAAFYCRLSLHFFAEPVYSKAR
jgi:hypothetical protein